MALVPTLSPLLFSYHGRHHRLSANGKQLMNYRIEPLFSPSHRTSHLAPQPATPISISFTLRGQPAQKPNSDSQANSYLNKESPLKHTLNGSDNPYNPYDRLLTPNALLWHLRIKEYTSQGFCEEALTLFYQMQWMGVQPDIATFPIVLKACARLSALEDGEEIHGHIITSGFESNVFVASAVIAMYVSCGETVAARQVFDKMSQPDVVSWNVMIAGYARNRCDFEALRVFQRMQLAGVKASSVTMVNVLPACAHLSAMPQGNELHGYIIRSGLETEPLVGSALVDMYSVCGHLQIARQVFDKMSQRDAAWNAMIRGYARSNLCEETLLLYRQMQEAGFHANQFTFPSVLKACEGLSSLQGGQIIHGHIIKSGFETDAFVGTALIDMYAKCGNIEDAQQMFCKMSKRDVVVWNSMIAGYSQGKHAYKALNLFRQMLLAGMKPNPFTFLSALGACAHLLALQQGKEMHEYMIRNGFESDVFVGSTLIDMYAKCGRIQASRLVFDNMLEKNVVSWNAMIAGYSQNGHANEALKLFGQMKLKGVGLDSITIIGALSACAHLAVLRQGKEIHEYVLRNGFEHDVLVGNSLTDMYAKCGSINFAWQVFNKMSQKNVVSWTAMIMGYGMHGLGEDALTLFHQMQHAGMKPDHITFIAILSACSHAGLVNEGWRYFHLMSEDYFITPMVEHYACMVDLLGRAGRLDDAQEFIKRMPVEPDASVWGALLGACRVHCNAELGKHVSECLFKLEPDNSGNYVLLSNIYAETGMWDDVVKIRTAMKDKGMKKMAGCSWIEVENQVHSFLAGDRSHSQSEKIHAILDSLAGPMGEEGYVPDTKFVLFDVKEEEKESSQPLR